MLKTFDWLDEREFLEENRHVLGFLTKPRSPNSRNTSKIVLSRIEKEKPESEKEKENAR